MALPSANAHWRDSARFPKFFMIDARAAFPLVLALVHIRVWTMLIALSAMVFFAILTRYGFTVSMFGRWVRGLIAGRRKIAIPWWLR